MISANMRPATPTVLRERLWCLAIFVLTFGLYLASAGPTLVAFRDAGEMVSSVSTLGILHPTSYPFYSLIGHCFEGLSIGNAAYRLNVFSAAAMAAAWVLLALFLRRQWACAWPVAAFAVGLGAVSYHFWAHALISEMYTLNIAFLCATLLALAHERYALAAFLFGLGCSNRSDLVLAAPALVVFFIAAQKSDWKREAVNVAACFVAGLSVYAYLPIRAATHPLLNWNDPSTFDRFLRSLFRLGYKGTLDLLSQSYGTGANFVSEFSLYLSHVWADFFCVGLLLSLVGMTVAFRRRDPLAWSLLLGFAITGPLFIFLGNLPPNPHAVAIMESSYLMPDIFLVIMIAIGMDRLFTLTRSRWRSIVVVGMVVIVGIGASCTWAQVNKRDHYFADDFIRNVYRMMPPSSLVVGRSDVPIFTLFYGHWGGFAPSDRIPVAQGLARSEWYQDMMARQDPGLALSGLSLSAEWAAVSKANPSRPMLATNDLDWPDGSITSFRPWGLLSRYVPPGQAPSTDAMPVASMAVFDCYRGDYRYGAHRDFFSNELIEEYAKAYLQDGSSLESLYHALVFQPQTPYATMRLAYIALAKNDWVQTSYYSRWSADQFKILLGQADAWKSFSGARASIAADYARVLCVQGVSEERVGHAEGAKELYLQSLDEDQTNADAHYNLAVLYWKAGDWPDVVSHLQSMAKYWPNDDRWKRYLPAALQRAGSPKV